MRRCLKVLMVAMEPERVRIACEHAQERHSSTRCLRERERERERLVYDAINNPRWLAYIDALSRGKASANEIVE